MKRAIPLAVLLLAFTAHADPAPVPGTTSEPQHRAQDLFNKGRIQYDLGEYQRSIELFRESYALSGEPYLLYNIAQAHRLSGDCVRALEGYRQFVRIIEERSADVQPSGVVKEARAQMGSLEKTCGAREAPRQALLPRASERPVEPAQQTFRKPLAAVIGVIAAGAFIAGAVFGHQAHVASAQSSNASTFDPALEARGRRDEKLEWGFLAGGAAATLAAGSMLLFRF